MQTLMLTPWMAPHKIISWQRAVVLAYLGKVEVSETWDAELRGPSVAMILIRRSRLIMSFPLRDIICACLPQALPIQPIRASGLLRRPHGRGAAPAVSVSWIVQPFCSPVSTSKKPERS